MPRHFKDWLSAYMEYTDFSEAPSAFHFWTGVSTVAGALRRRVWIDQRHFEWIPNFYIILVAPPGVATKSTSINIGHDLLREVPGINFGPASATWQALAESVAEAKEMVPLDETEGLEGMLMPMSCITLSISELGTMIDTENPQLITMLIDLWDGKKTTWEHKTRTQGKLEIENPWINMIGATTPSWLAKNFDTNIIEGGLTSRMIFVFANAKKKLIAYPSEEIMDDKFMKFKGMLIEDLIEISQMLGPFTLSNEAKEWGRGWYERHWTTRPEHLAEDRYGGYLARKQTHLHKLAMILAAASNSKRRVLRVDLENADRIITALEQDMVKVFNSMGQKESQRHMREIVAILKVNGEIDQRVLWRRCMNVMKQDEYNGALASLAKAQYIEVRTTQGRTTYRPLVDLNEINIGG